MGRDDAITRQAAFFASVRTQKLPTLRWSLRHGGCRLDLRDEDENTPIMIASAENKLKALLELCDYARHNDLLYTMNLVDSDGMYAVAGCGCVFCRGLLKLKRRETLTGRSMCMKMESTLDRGVCVSVYE